MVCYNYPRVVSEDDLCYLKYYLDYFNLSLYEFITNTAVLLRTGTTSTDIQYYQMYGKYSFSSTFILSPDVTVLAHLQASTLVAQTEFPQQTTQFDPKTPLTSASTL